MVHHADGAGRSVDKTVLNLEDREYYFFLDDDG